MQLCVGKVFLLFYSMGLNSGSIVLHDLPPRSGWIDTQGIRSGHRKGIACPQQLGAKDEFSGIGTAEGVANPAAKI